MLPSNTGPRAIAASLSLTVHAVALAGAPDPVAVYPFNGDFSSLVPGAPDLTPVGEGGTSFQTQTFVGRTTGTWVAPIRNGLVLDTSGFLGGDAWTVGITFRYDGFLGGYRKILDTQNRTVDFGWYSFPGSPLGYFPTGSGPTPFFEEEVTVVIAVDGADARGYLDGALEVTVSGRPEINIGIDGLIHFLLDDFPFNAEDADATIAAIFVWDVALDDDAVAGLLPLPLMIEPCSPADQNMPFGIIDLADINKFVTNFLGQEPPADIDDNGIFDLADIIAFVDGFGSGCP